MHACDLNACTNLHCSRRMFTLAAPRSCAVTSSTNAFNGVGRHHAPLLPRSNPHSARHDRVPLPAVSFLGGFRTPAPSLGVRGPSVIGRHPKPFTQPAASPLLGIVTLLGLWAGICGRKRT